MTDWTERANCRNWINPDEWFQPRGVGTKQLRALCNACAVNLDCLKWAIEHETWGYWAGTDEEMRDQLRRRNGIELQPISAWPDRDPPEFQPCGTAAAAKRHERRGEPKCEPCRVAAMEANRKAQERRNKKREKAS